MTTTTEIAEAAQSSAKPAPRKRATAMPPEQRRRMILDATIELLTENGLNVTTKQIAAASGIAEGTLFTVFKSKDECVQEAVLQFLCGEELFDKFDALDPELELRELLYRVADLLDADLRKKHAFMSACRIHPPFFADADETRRKMHDWQEARSGKLMELINKHADELTVPTNRLLYILDSALFANASWRVESKGKCPVSGGLTPRSAVDLLLDGALKTNGLN